MFSDQIGTPNMRIRHMQGNVGHSRTLTYFKAQNPNTWNHWHIELSHFEGFQVGKGTRLRPEEERYQVRGEKKTYELNIQWKMKVILMVGFMLTPLHFIFGASLFLKACWENNLKEK